MCIKNKISGYKRIFERNKPRIAAYGSLYFIKKLGEQGGAGKNLPMYFVDDIS